MSIKTHFRSSAKPTPEMTAFIPPICFLRTHSSFGTQSRHEPSSSFAWRVDSRHVRTKSRPRCRMSARDERDADAEQAKQKQNSSDTASDSSAPFRKMASNRMKYSQRTRLREETEAPFRKARMFVFAGSAISAGVGAFIAGLRIIAASIGISGVQPLNETVPNVAINLSVVSLCAFLLRQEGKAGEKRLERMSRGARIASLRIEDGVTRKIMRLKELRGKRRVVLIAGAGEQLKKAMEDAENMSEQISASNLVIVPFVYDNDESVSLTACRMKPYGIEEWRKWMASERETAKKQMREAGDVLVVIIRLDGKVGARSAGAPLWPKLVAEVAKLPKADKYGKP